jgi:hypothetical protein
MATRPFFSQSDSDNIERVRQSVLCRLTHDEDWNQFGMWTGRAGNYVEVEHPQFMFHGAVCEKCTPE